VMLLYPEHAQSDFIQDVGEPEPLMPHLVEMFGVQGENAPPWDTGRRYAAPRLAVYAPFPHPEEDGKEAVLPLRVDQPLLDQLRRAQKEGYRIPGIPVLHVVLKGSEYERDYFLNRLVRPR
jgi:hypothetical protein